MSNGKQDLTPFLFLAVLCIWLFCLFIREILKAYE